MIILKLTNEDKKLLKNWGYPDEDLTQIERATTKTKYELARTSFNTSENKISTDEAIEILGRKEYLSGIARSAFHWSACRQNEKGQTVYFNSSKLFR